MNQDNFVKPTTQESHAPINITTPHSRIFSIILQYMKWISSLRWYVIVLIVMVVMFVIFQFEQSIESRRRKNKSEKEGMMNETPKGIIKYGEIQQRSNLKKKVSFTNTNDDSILLENPHEKVSTLSENVANVYNWWILPGAYVLFRKIGLA